MKFFRQQEEKLAVRLLVWQHEKSGTPLPPMPELERKAAELVDEAHRIARQRGKNVVAILKDLVADLKR